MPSYDIQYQPPSVQFNVNEDFKGQNNKGPLSGAIGQLLGPMLNKAKRGAINEQSQIDMAKELAELFSQIQADMLKLLAATSPAAIFRDFAALFGDLNKLAALKKGQFGRGLSPKAKAALQNEVNKAIAGFKKSLDSIFTGKANGPLKAILDKILDSNGNLSQNEILGMADKAALTVNMKTARNALEAFEQACGTEAGSMISLSEILSAKLNWYINTIQELMSAASKIADKAFKVELQMQGRIRG